jgi:hypothetical protein
MKEAIVALWICHVHLRARDGIRTLNFSVCSQLVLRINRHIGRTPNSARSGLYNDKEKAAIGDPSSLQIEPRGIRYRR